MKHIESYKDLDVWKLSIEQCVLVYEITRLFPKDELYGLAAQFKRAAVSVPANIAEGYARRYEKEKARFVSTALGSNAEVETHGIVAQRLGYLNEGDALRFFELNDHLGRSLTSFHRKLER